MYALSNVLLFRKISPNCKTLFYKTFSRNLAYSALKVSKTFHTCLLACFALKVSKTFHKNLACLLYFALKVSKTFYKPLACLLYFALKVSKTFYKHGSLGSTACFKSL